MLSPAFAGIYDEPLHPLLAVIHSLDLGIQKGWNSSVFLNRGIILEPSREIGYTEDIQH